MKQTLTQPDSAAGRFHEFVIFWQMRVPRPHLKSMHQRQLFLQVPRCNLHRTCPNSSTFHGSITSPINISSENSTLHSPPKSASRSRRERNVSVTLPIGDGYFFSAYIIPCPMLVSRAISDHDPEELIFGPTPEYEGDGLSFALAPEAVNMLDFLKS